jgi:hypothetical protein
VFATLALAFAGGVMGGNAVPHFVRGITKQRYPNIWGGGPVPNVVAGWGGLLLAAWMLRIAFDGSSPLGPFCAMAIGVLLIGLFHAGPGAFGRR